MYKIKQIPEDFIVKEIPVKKPQHTGKYLYFTLKKKNRNTLDVVKEIARRLNVKEKQIGFAGSKDKHAVTEQLVSFYGITTERVLGLSLENVSLQFYGLGNEPITLGNLQGNYFEITVRSLGNKEIEPIEYVENYFDEQRFSSNNVQIGKFMLLKQFKEAIRLIDYEPCNCYLVRHPNDYVGALKEIPLRLLRMYINAYQSYLWNETLSCYLLQKGTVIKEIPYSQGKLIFSREIDTDLKIPLIGFDTPQAEENMNGIITQLLENEGITTTDFIIRQIPQLSIEGELRNAFIKVKDMKLGDLKEDDLNKGRKKIKITFSLPKGSYATMAIKRIFG